MLCSIPMNFIVFENMINISAIFQNLASYTRNKYLFSIGLIVFTFFSIEKYFAMADSTMPEMLFHSWGHQEPQSF